MLVRVLVDTLAATLPAAVDSVSAHVAPARCCCMFLLLHVAAAIAAIGVPCTCLDFRRLLSLPDELSIEHPSYF